MEGILDCTEKINGHADFVGAMHLGFYDVHGACSRVTTFVCTAQVVQRASCGEKRIHDALENFVALSVENGGVGHQVTDVANEHEAATGQGNGIATGGCELAVFI